MRSGMRNGTVGGAAAGMSGAALPEVGSCVVGTVVALDAARGIQVTFSGQEDEPLSARSVVALAADDVGRQAVLVFEDGDLSRPIVLGVLQVNAVREETAEEAAGTLPRDRQRDIRVDGRSVRIEAERELVLQCGKSSITLRAGGEVYVKGMKIVSRARGTHKIKGANVLIN